MGLIAWWMAWGMWGAALGDASASPSTPSLLETLSPPPDFYAFALGVAYRQGKRI